MQPPNISATVTTPLEVIATSCNLWDDKRNRVALVSNYDFLATDKIRQLKGCWIFLLYCVIFGYQFCYFQPHFLNPGPFIWGKLHTKMHTGLHTAFFSSFLPVFPRSPTNSSWHSPGSRISPKCRVRQGLAPVYLWKLSKEEKTTVIEIMLYLPYNSYACYD